MQICFHQHWMLDLVKENIKISVEINSPLTLSSTNFLLLTVCIKELSYQCFNMHQHAMNSPSRSPLSPVILAAVLFGVVWSITEDECLPGGNLFGITILFICALLGGKLVALIRLPKLPPFPPLLGKAEKYWLCFTHWWVNVFFLFSHTDAWWYLLTQYVKC